MAARIVHHAAAEIKSMKNMENMESGKTVKRCIRY